MSEYLMTVGAGYVLRLAEAADAVNILPDLRYADHSEWRQSALGGVEKNLLDSIMYSAECYAVADREARRPHILFGVVDTKPVPQTWLLGTYQGQRDCGWILRECSEFYAAFFQRWPHTRCFSATNNTVHHRWLQWMGYRRMCEVPWGPYGLPFYEFDKGGD